MNDPGFARRYGPWAVVAGASEGVGAEFARAVADHGVNVVLLARRQGVLDEMAAAIRADTAVEARAIAVDLSDDDAAGSVVDATADLDVGLLMYCAGADPNYASFLGSPVDTALAMVHRNCVVPMALCHHFAAGMVDRGAGGIVLVGSGAGLVGGPNMVAYAATKAFDMVMAESLWAELHDRGVDVLGLILGVTDTPALRRLLASRGQLPSVDDSTPIPGAATAEEVVAEALANLSNGPTWFVGEQLREGAKHLGGMARGDAVRMLIRMSATTMGNDLETG